MSSTLVNDIESKNNLGRSITDLFFKDKNVLVKHHLDSFNNFIDTKLNEIFEEYNISKKNSVQTEFDKDINDYRLSYNIKFGNVYLSKPALQENQTIIRQMYPNVARLQNLTYSSQIKVDIYHKLIERVGENGTVKETEFAPLLKHPIGKVIMLNSKYCILSDISNMTKSDMGECMYDYGGYFIVNGNEKVIIMQERKAENMVFVFKQSKGANKFSHKCEISSVSENNPYSVKNTEVKLTSKEGTIGRTLKVKLQGFRQEIPLFILFRCLDVISDKSICELICGNLDEENSKKYLQFLRPSIEESTQIQSRLVALEYASKYLIVSSSQKWFLANTQKLHYTQDILRSELLPHVGNNLKKKALFLGYMVKKLLDAIIDDKYDDRDSFINKRVDTSGELLAFLFRTNFRKMMRDVETNAKNELGKRRFDDLSNGLSKKIKKSTIESGLKYGLSTGNWGLKNQNIQKRKELHKY